MLHLDVTANGQEIEVAVGHSFELCLPENPTTGFRWVMRSDGKPVCTLLSDQFQPGDLTPGQGGRHCWQFQVVQIGEGSLTLTYQRPWEQVGADTQTFTLQVRVRS
jgi:inhibitor of cysteine peptidase